MLGRCGRFVGGVKYNHGPPHRNPHSVRNRGDLMDVTAVTARDVSNASNVSICVSNAPVTCYCEPVSVSVTAVTAATVRREGVTDVTVESRRNLSSPFKANPF